MRILASITAALLFTFMLASAPAFAQEDRPDHAQDQSQDKDKNNKETKDNKETKEKDKSGAKQNDNGRQEETRPEGRENAHPENAKPENAKPEAARPQEQTRPEEQNRPQDRSNDRRNDNMGRQEQARPEERGGRDQRVANGGRGQRIPDDQFRTHFGREHHFHVQRAQIVNQAQPQFVYGGYTFVLQQPWPAEWAFDDDCYVDYVDGDYYMYDLNHPGIQILVFVIG